MGAGIGRYVSARLSRFEEKLIMEMARREHLSTAEMVRQCIIREAVRPMFGQPPLSEGLPDGQN